ncbi:MAG TPA: cytochrome c3 family protein [Vicinamibacterales bacterium]|nr:cytochrome c3 family protein [Vicinamibacterales bacterium]
MDLTNVRLTPSRCLLSACLMTFFAVLPLDAQTPPAANSCVACHSVQADQRVSTPARLFSAQDVHREKGFECVDCHGGSPTSADKTAAHDASGRTAAMAFRGKPTGQAVVTTCARCHRDPELMRAFAPKQRVDQATEYATSVHGKRLAAGDVRVATCASCHGAHGIRLVSDAKSPVFPTNVATTCASCHANERRMAGYTLPDGSPLPTHQFADYQTSVHYAALTKGNDLSAPTCNDCHGNHGAAPPDVGAVAHVCGACHAVFAQKFASSVHQQIVDKGCVECHSNHAVVKPSDQMLSASAPGVCEPCHNGEDKTDHGAAAAATMRADIDRLKAGIDRSSAALTRLKNAGIEVSDQQLALREAGTKLTLARTEMHGFDPAPVTAILADGMKIVSGVDAARQRGALELRFRRRGLFVSLAAILVLVVALGLKVRQIDRRDA